MSATTSLLELSAQDIASIHRMIEPWNRACTTRDWHALLAMCTPDVIFLPPQSKPMQGTAINGWLNTFPTIKAMWWDIKQLEGRGDLACLRGAVRQTLVIDGQDVLFDGKYFDTMRKEADGVWRFATIMWNSNA